MSDNLYKAKRIDNGEWVYGNLIELKDKHTNNTIYTIIENPNNRCYSEVWNGGGCYSVLPETITVVDDTKP